MPVFQHLLDLIRRVCVLIVQEGFNTLKNLNFNLSVEVPTFHLFLNTPARSTDVLQISDNMIYHFLQSDFINHLLRKSIRKFLQFFRSFCADINALDELFIEDFVPVLDIRVDEFVLELFIKIFQTWARGSCRFGRKRSDRWSDWCVPFCCPLYVAWIIEPKETTYTRQDCRSLTTKSGSSGDQTARRYSQTRRCWLSSSDQ